MRTVATSLLMLSLSGCGSLFFYSPDGSNEMRFGPGIQNYFLPSGSGNDLHIQLHTPPGAVRGSIIHFHGNSGHLGETGEKALWLIKEGYQVLLFDYSGFGLSSGQADRASLAKDAQALLEHVVSHPDMQQGPLILLATSMGGAIALDGLRRSQLEGHFALLVIDSSFDRYSLLARDVVKNYPGGVMWRQIIPLMVNDQGSPVEQIATLSGLPVVISHCAEDRLIPAQRSAELFDAATTSKEYWLLPQCGHARTFTDQFPNHQQKLLNRFRLLPAATTTASPVRTAGPHGAKP